MTDDDLNMALAEALSLWTTTVKQRNGELVSATHEPPAFTTDGNAMPALIDAMRKRGYAARYWSGPQIPHSCIFFNNTAGLEEIGADADMFPRAVAEAAAKALGVWEE